MAKWQIAFIAILMMMSMLMFFIPSLRYGIRKLLKKPVVEKRNKTGISMVLTFSVILILSIWFLRFAVGYFAIINPNGDEKILLSPGEEIVNSLFKAIRTFSMEEDYAAYISDIKCLITAIVPNHIFCFSFIKFFAVLYASVLNFLAPIAGGAIILEIVSSVFPNIRLRWSYKLGRPKYFFSELNSASLALAKSIYEKEKSRKPILIFTDTYVDDENEKEYELLLEAKKYGAICVRDDLAHVVKTKKGKRSYYLMDENEFGNLQTLMGLVENHNVKFISDSYIYLFVQSDAYVQVEKQVTKLLASDEKQKLLGNGKKPTIVPVNGYRNLVHNLFVEVPLYEPLIHKNDRTKLTLTILGNGIIGTEAFLSAYWFGQMMVSEKKDGKETMTGCEVTVNVVSKDSEDVFWSKIDYVNPEIKQTVEILNEGKAEYSKELLAYDKYGNVNSPYCKVRYFQSDVKIGGFWDWKFSIVQNLFESDYFIVALGNDADNISVAEKLRRSIGQKRLEGMIQTSNTVIAYAVFDSELAKTLNGSKRYQTINDKQTDIYMHAFGSQDQVYSCDNVYISKNSIWAKETGIGYYKKSTEYHISDNIKRTEEDVTGDYEYWANLARASHIKYKVFSLGWIKKSVFDYISDTVKVSDDELTDIIESEEDHKKCDCVTAYMYHRYQVARICSKYMLLTISNSIGEGDSEISQAREELEFKKHCLAWLEHRRWNAFTRTMGYQYINADNILNIKGSQKDMELKLHSCLVEARQPELSSDDTYIYAAFDEKGKVDFSTMFKSFPSEKSDRLDEVSCKKKGLHPEKNVCDFKVHDYYQYELSENFSSEVLSELLKKMRISM